MFPVGSQVTVPAAKGSKAPPTTMNSDTGKTSAGEIVELGEKVTAEKDETYEAYFVLGEYTVTFQIENTKYGMFVQDGKTTDKIEKKVTGRQTVTLPSGAELQPEANCEFVTWKDDTGEEISYLSFQPDRNMVFTAVFGPENSFRKDFL